MAVLSRFLQASAALLAAVTVNATPVERRSVIDSDAVVGFAETVPTGTVGAVYEAFKPYLKIVNGCVPFPAIDASGNTGYVSSLNTREIIVSNMHQRRTRPYRFFKWWLQ